MSKKQEEKPKDSTPEPQELAVAAKEELKAEESDEFVADGRAYLPVWNETFKRYDMLIIYVNKDTMTTYIEREATKYDTEHRALHDIVKRVSDDFMKKKDQ